MDNAVKFQQLVQFRVPTGLSEAIDAAARRRCQSKSEYVRQSVIGRLDADGVEVQTCAGAA
ncbi:putative DNA-binding protein [Bradyrhizobium sp. F1.13.1]